MLFNVNGKEYKSKEFDFNMICELEDVGVSIEQITSKPLSMVRAYFAICTGRDRIFAGAEIAEHIKNGGSLNDIMEVMTKEMELSDFFRTLAESAEMGNPKSKTTKKQA